jgi:hypothetical protein
VPVQLEKASLEQGKMRRLRPQPNCFRQKLASAGQSRRVTALTAQKEHCDCAELRPQAILAFDAPQFTLRAARYLFIAGLQTDLQQEDTAA